MQTNSDPLPFSMYSYHPFVSKSIKNSLNIDKESKGGWGRGEIIRKNVVCTECPKCFYNRPFPSCFEPHYENKAKCKVFVMKSSFYSYANKIYFHTKSFALSLAFIVSSQQLGNGLLLVHVAGVT